MGPGCVVFLSLIITALQIEESVGKPDAIIACPGILTSYDCPIFDDESDFPLSIWSIESCPELQISHKPSGHPSLESDTCGPFTVQPTGSNGTHYTSTLSFIASIEQNGTEITVRNGANGEIVCRAEILVQEPDSFSVSVTTNATTGATVATCSLSEDFIGPAYCRLVVFDSYGHNYTFLSDEQVHAGTSVTLNITLPDGSPLKPDIVYSYNATLDNGVDATLSCKLLSGTITPSSDVSSGGNETEGNGLSVGAIIGIAVGIVMALGIVVAVGIAVTVVVLCYKYKKGSDSGGSGQHPPTPEPQPGVEEAGVGEPGVEEAGVGEPGVEEAGVGEPGVEEAGVGEPGVEEAKHGGTPTSEVVSGQNSRGYELPMRRSERALSIDKADSHESTESMKAVADAVAPSVISSSSPTSRSPNVSKSPTPASKCDPQPFILVHNSSERGVVTQLPVSSKSENLATNKATLTYKTTSFISAQWYVIKKESEYMVFIPCSSHRYRRLV